MKILSLLVKALRAILLGITIVSSALLNIFFLWTSGAPLFNSHDWNLPDFYWNFYSLITSFENKIGAYSVLYHYMLIHNVRAPSTSANLLFVDLLTLSSLLVLALSLFLWYLPKGIFGAALNMTKFVSLSVLPLGLDIGLFDRRDWLNHVTTFQSNFGFFSSFSNADVLLVTATIFVTTSFLLNDFWITKISGFVIENKQKVALLSVVIGSSIIAAVKLFQVLQWNALEHDSASFLYNGLYLAGISNFRNEYDITRPPFIPAVLATVFKITQPSAVDGYVLSAILFVSAGVGCYLIAKTLMSKPFAILAATTFMISPVVYGWAGDVLSNVEGVGLGTLGFGLSIYAIDEGRKNWLLVSVPLMICAVFTRYTMFIFLPLFVLYVVMIKKYDILETDHFTFSGIIAGSLGFGLGYIWTGGGALSLRDLIPPSSTSPSTCSVYGQLFYFAYLPEAAGYGILGIFVVLLFIAGTSYFIYSLIRKNLLGKIQIILLLWFALLVILYNTWADDIRYASEFIMPVIIIGFWALYEGFKFLKSRPKVRIALFALLLIFISLTFTFIVGYISPLEGSLNKGMLQTAQWVDSNIPSNATFVGNDYTLLSWYLPKYHVYAIYNVQNKTNLCSIFGPISVSYILSTAINDNATYVEYSAGVLNSSLLLPVFISSIGNITIYKVR